MKNYKGKFTPKNPKKYKGDPTNIIWRSLWERKTMSFLDENPNILEWSSEEVIIPYKSPVDNRYHRYFPDFLVKYKMKDDTIKTMVIEIKPKNQTKEPKVQKRVTKKYLYEVTTWGINQAKWKSAEEYCADRKWEFRILTEDDLGIK